MQELKELERWILWIRNASGTKLPANRWKQVVSCLDDKCWLRYDQAYEILQEHYDVFEGVGFVFAADDPYIGVDLDNACDKWDVKPWAQPIVDKFSSTYYELSPSLRGLKIWGRGKKHQFARSHIRWPYGGVECYDSGRWFAYTGFNFPGTAEDAPVVDVQESIDWLYREIIPSSAIQKIRADAGQRAISGGSLEARVRAYVDACLQTPILPGERNNRLYIIAKHLFDFEHEGEVLGLDDVKELMHDTNARLPDPLSETEVEKLCESAQKNGRPRNPKLSRQMPDDTGVDLSGLILSLEDARQPTQKPEKSLPEFPQQLLEAPGFISEFAEEMLDTAYYPQPQLALGAALAVLSTITGRKIEDHSGLRTNLYLVCVAPTGSGKEHYRGCISTLLELAGCGELVGPERIASNSGLVSRLSQTPASVWCLDEMGRMLEAIKRSDGKSAHLHAIISVLLQIYTQSSRVWRGDAYADIERNPVINQPHMVVYGSTTPDAFWASMDSRSLQDGFIGRLSPLFGQYVDRNPRATKYRPSSSVLSFVKRWLNHSTGGDLDAENPEPTVANWTQMAKDALEDHAVGIDARRRQESLEAAAVLSRVSERAKKLAILLAVSRGHERDLTPPVSIDDVEMAIDLSEWMAAIMLSEYEANVACNQNEADYLKVAKIVRECGEDGIAKRDLLRRCRTLTARRRNEILSDLVESGQCEIRQTGQRMDRVVFVWAG